MAWRCAATATSNSRRKSPYLPTRTLPTFGPSGSIPRGRSTLPEARLRKYFASIRTASLLSSSIPLTSPRKPSPLTPKALFTSALLPTARFTGSLLPERNPCSSIPKRNTSGTWLFRPTGLSMSPPVTKGRSSRSRPTARANSSTPATKLTFAFWHSTQKATSSPARNPADAFCASPGVPRRHQ